jgi:Probable cobalt transporter subunit (CbtA)
MVWTLLRRGLVVGAVAGLLAGAFAFAVGEPEVQRAIDLEAQTQAAVGHGHAAPEPIGHTDKVIVSRNGQRAGLFLATTLYGLMWGGLFALAFALARGRLRAPSDWALSTRMAGCGFVAVVLVPFLKYPANPPGIGNPDTIGSRTALYVVMLAISLLALLAAIRVGRAVGDGGAPWRRPAAAIGTFVVLCVLAAVVLPGVDEVPDGFPADLLWQFRLSSLGVQAILWTALGVGFGVLSHRAQTATRTAAARTA